MICVEKSGWEVFIVGRWIRILFDFFLFFYLKIVFKTYYFLRKKSKSGKKVKKNRFLIHFFFTTQIVCLIDNFPKILVHLINPIGKIDIMLHTLLDIYLSVLEISFQNWRLAAGRTQLLPLTFQLLHLVFFNFCNCILPFQLLRLARDHHKPGQAHIAVSIFNWIEEGHFYGERFGTIYYLWVHTPLLDNGLWNSRL